MPDNSLPGTRPIDFSKVSRYFIIILFISSLSLTLHLANKFYADKNDIQENTKTELVELTVNASNYIDQIAKAIIKDGDSLAMRISNAGFTKKTHLAELRKTIKENNYIHGGSITFRPYGYRKDKELYAPYYFKQPHSKKLTHKDIADEKESYLDATWYANPIKEKENSWGEPYRDIVGETTMITYSAVFYDKAHSASRIPLGVVTLDVSTDRLRQLVEKELNIGFGGFPALTTQSGNYLYHPVYEYVRNLENLSDVANKFSDSNRVLMAKEILLGNSGIIDHISTTTGKASWLVFSPIPLTGWSIQNTYIKNSLNTDLNSQRHQLFHILIVALLSLIALSALVFRIDKCNRIRLWWFSGTTAALLTLGIWGMWYLALTYHDYESNDNKPINNVQSLKYYTDGVTKERKTEQLDPPAFINTGVYIDAIEFKGANDILIAGRLWQRFNLSDKKSLPGKNIGVEFPHAKQTKFSVIGEHKTDDELIKHWRFSTEIRFELDYSRYPLERENIMLRMRAKSNGERTLLIPDLGAYKLLTPTLKPGLDKAVFLPGWEIDSTHFSFMSTDKLTNFGIERSVNDKDLDDLLFEISMTRVFVDAFISNLTPLVVALIVLFALTLLAEKIEIGRVISICVAVFFVVVFSHLDIRKNIATGEIFYLEYFFFVVYIAIILVPINPLRIAFEKSITAFDFQDGIIHKTLYWPSIMTLFFLITLKTFY